MPKNTGSYYTTEEIRANPSLVDGGVSTARRATGGGTRFEGSTVPELALKYVSKGAEVLECGPLTGAFTKYLQENEYQNIHLADFVDVLHFPDKEKLASFHITDFNHDRLPFDDDSLDALICWGMVEHLENPFFFIREARRVLKKDTGIFIFSVPNVFHLMSKLLFFKRGMFPRWNATNNHISILPHGVFEKTVLPYFTLVEERYIKPHFTYLFFDRFKKWMPSNSWFGAYVVYVLKTRDYNNQ
jgi:ubiquinone/menaquinone biosynthesis C-methylase UbiE